MNPRRSATHFRAWLKTGGGGGEIQRVEDTFAKPSTSSVRPVPARQMEYIGPDFHDQQHGHILGITLV